MSNQIESALEALLLLATEPLPVSELAAALELAPAEVELALTQLRDFYDETGRGFQLRNIAGGWQLATREEHAELIKKWVVEGQENKLTQASLETLTIIAYLQPVTRSRVSAVRGVNADGVVRTLIARGLVSQEEATEGDEARTGAALLGTTDYFLQRLGLASLDDLPPIAPLLPDASVLESELAQLATDNNEPGQPASQPETSETEPANE